MPVAEIGIPFIDLEKFGDGTSPEARDIGERFYAACRDVGFAYLTNHGVSQENIDEMFDYSKRFFELPAEIKTTAPHPPAGDHHRGYSGIGVEQVSQMVFDEDKLAEMRGKGADFKESFDVGSEGSQYMSNIWLDDHYLPGFKAYCLYFQKQCRDLQMRVLRALAIGMPDVPDNFFESYHSAEGNQLRLLHYPSAPRTIFDSGEKGRIAAHTVVALSHRVSAVIDVVQDFSTCTFLFQDDCGGLEVENPSGSGHFISAPPVPGAIVFNIGDFLMRWSNDALKSTLHRVRAPAPLSDDHGMTRERYSIPYFCGANKDLIIDAIPGTWSATQPKKYEPITSGEYIDMRLNATYMRGGAKLNGNKSS